MVLPAGTRFPPLLHGVLVITTALAVIGALVRERPEVTPRTTVALAPWMVTGGALYVIAELALVPPALTPFISSPTVYVTTFVLAGATWLAVRRLPVPDEEGLATVGSVAALPPALIAIGYAIEANSFQWVPSTLALVLSVVVSVAGWLFLRQIRPTAATITGGAGVLVVFAHSLDGISTAVGVDILEFGERTPLSAFLLEVGAGLPTEPYLGAGWLFVTVKVLLAVGLVVLLSDYVEEDPTEGSLLLAAVAAVGLGPGAHNLLLFATAMG